MGLFSTGKIWQVDSWRSLDKKYLKQEIYAGPGKQEKYKI
jgi:hypothetical protein